MNAPLFAVDVPPCKPSAWPAGSPFCRFSVEPPSEKITLVRLKLVVSVPMPVATTRSEALKFQIQIESALAVAVQQKNKMVTNANALSGSDEVCRESL